jgi:hypothetical protein
MHGRLGAASGREGLGDELVALSTPDHKVVGSIPSRVKFLFSVSLSSLRAFWTSRIRAGSLKFQCQ